MSVGRDDFLGGIVAASRRRVEESLERKSMADLEREALRRTPAGAAFRTALGAVGLVNVIAECKRRSPTKGVLSAHYDPAAIAKAYERGGAAAVSVLTEPTCFDGSLQHLQRVCAAVDLPVMRKDFIVDSYQLLEARASGADAVLLIVAALDRAALARLLRHANALGLGVLVETHAPDEIQLAIDEGASIIGVNSRNLRTLEVDRHVCDRLIGEIPPGCVAVAESGIRSVDDVRHLRGLGYQAVLIGEWLMTAAEPSNRVKQARAATVDRTGAGSGGC